MAYRAHARVCWHSVVARLARTLGLGSSDIRLPSFTTLPEAVTRPRSKTPISTRCAEKRNTACQVQKLYFDRSQGIASYIVRHGRLRFVQRKLGQFHGNCCLAHKVQGTKFGSRRLRHKIASTPRSRSGMKRFFPPKNSTPRSASSTSGTQRSRPSLTGGRFSCCQSFARGLTARSTGRPTARKLGPGVGTLLRCRRPCQAGPPRCAGLASNVRPRIRGHETAEHLRKCNMPFSGLVENIRFSLDVPNT